MSTQLYVFSATGNSLNVAQRISSRLDDAEVISIPSVKEGSEIRADVIGIVSPIYMHYMPHIVADLIKKIKKAHYIFFVYTGGGELGNGINKTKNLFKKQGLQLSSLFNVTMPSNYTPYGCPSADQQKKILDEMKNKVNEIIPIIQKQGEYIDKNNTSFLASYIHPGLLYKLGYRMINTMDRSFTVDDNCNGCSICQQVCPVSNISITGGKPEWHNKCQQCFACLQWCPKQAIQYGDKTLETDRYHHPEIKLNDIIELANK